MSYQRSALSGYRRQAVLGGILAVVIAFTLAVGVTYLPLATSTSTIAPNNNGSHNFSTTSTISSSGSKSYESAPSSCIVEVPNDTTIESFSNSTVSGYQVVYSNGTIQTFQLYSCPLPAKPNIYEIASVIQQNQQFIAVENGSSYFVDPTGFIGIDRANQNGTWISYSILDFFLYSSQKIFPCGGSVFWTYNELGAIQVLIPTNSTGGYNLSDVRITKGSLNIFTCLTQITTSSNST